MRRVTIVLLAVMAVGMLAGPVGAEASSARSTCGLPGLVQAAPGRCPPTTGVSDGAESSDSLLSSVFGDAIKPLVTSLVTIVNQSAATALRVTASLMNATTAPALTSAWFSATYWRMATLATLLTVPFLFAAAVHALVRSEPALLGRAAFGYLPLAMLGVAIAAPLTMLVLSATDEMSAFVAGSAGNTDAAFLARAATDITSGSVIAAEPMVAFAVGALTVAATLALWIELLIRSVAVDIVVLLLPLFFAAMVWPARRVWATRTIETLIALILSKLVIVAVLTLGGAALGAVQQGGTSGLTALLTGATLILLAVLSPWAVLRLLPLHELAAATAGGLSQVPHDAFHRARQHLRDPQRDGRSGGHSSAPQDGGPSGLGAEEDPASALRRMVSIGGGGLAAVDAGAHLMARGASGWGGSGGSRGSGDWGDRAAVGDDGPSPWAAGDGVGGSAGDVTNGPGPAGDGDTRPPVPDLFDPRREWKVLTLGEEGDDIMRAPEFVDDDPAPEVPPPAPAPDPPSPEAPPSAGPSPADPGPPGPPPPPDVPGTDPEPGGDPT